MNIVISEYELNTIHFMKDNILNIIKKLKITVIIEYKKRIYPMGYILIMEK